MVAWKIEKLYSSFDNLSVFFMAIGKHEKNESTGIGVFSD